MILSSALNSCLIILSFFCVSQTFAQVKLPDYASFHRSICIDYLYYNKDGTIKRMLMTSEGVQPEKNKYAMLRYTFIIPVARIFRKLTGLNDPVKATVS